MIHPFVEVCSRRDAFGVVEVDEGGRQVNRVEGSHYILTKENSEIHLSIPVHKNKILGLSLLKKLIQKAGLTNDKSLKYFYIQMISLDRVRRVLCFLKWIINYYVIATGDNHFVRGFVELARVSQDR